MAVRRDSAYRRLAESLRGAVFSGKYGEDRPLPTEEQLAAEFGVSRSTVRRAMQDLVAEGAIYRVPGRGTFPLVQQDRYLRQVGSVEDLMALSEDTEAEIISPLEARVDIEAAGRLALDEDRVMSLTLRRLYGVTPFAVTTIVVPVSVGRVLESDPRFTDLGRRSRVTAIGRIEELIPGTIADAEQSISAVAASDSVAEALTCEPGTPILRIDRLYSDVDGRPVELAMSYFDPAHYTYRVRLRYHPG